MFLCPLEFTRTSPNSTCFQPVSIHNNSGLKSVPIVVSLVRVSDIICRTVLLVKTVSFTKFLHEDIGQSATCKVDSINSVHIRFICIVEKYPLKKKNFGSVAASLLTG